MTTSVANRVKKDMFRVVWYQLLIILGFTALLFLLKGIPNGMSALAGAMSYWLPTVLFIWRVSNRASAHVGIAFLATFIVGEGIKLLLCGVLVVIFIKYFGVLAIDAIMGLIGAIIAFWLASATLMSKTGAKS